MTVKNTKPAKGQIPQRAGKEKNDLMGVMVLALGVSAFLGVGVYAGVKYLGKRNANAPVASEVRTDGMSEGEAMIVQKKTEIEKKLPAQAASMASPSIQDISGTWRVSFGDGGIAVLFLTKDFFQLTLTTDKSGASRKYSRGVAVYDERYGNLRLIPTEDAGKPKEIKGVTYSVLTMRPYDVLVMQKKGDPALYFTALEVDLMAKTFHPLFLMVDYSGAPVLKWEKIEAQQ